METLLIHALNLAITITTRSQSFSVYISNRYTHFLVLILNTLVVEHQINYFVFTFYLTSTRWGKTKNLDLCFWLIITFHGFRTLSKWGSTCRPYFVVVVSERGTTNINRPIGKWNLLQMTIILSNWILWKF